MLQRYLDILQKDDAKVLITGDSLSYNRYSYYDEPRMNAYECGVGMQSWSFRLRDRIYALDSQLILGNKLQFNCKAVEGIDSDSADKFAAAFSSNVSTLTPMGDVNFSADIKSEKIVLYLQTRLENFCDFDIYVDGELRAKNVSTKGDKEFFVGYSLLPVVLDCDASLSTHTIEFKNIKGDKPKVTVAAVGSKKIDINLTGKGSQTTRFFLDNFDERIGRFAPDLLIIILSANDRGRVAPEVMRKDLLELFARIFKVNKDCKILFLQPPHSHFGPKPHMDSGIYSSIDTANVYNTVICDVIENLGKDWYRHPDLDGNAEYDIEVLPVYELFGVDNPSEWRADNIHLNQNGNNVLFKAVCDKLGI